MPKNPERKIAAVILAAGGSARFGTPKQLLTIHGENIVHRSARIAVEAGLDPIIVVLGAYASSIELFLSGLERVTTVINENWESGQASSLRAGIERAALLKCDAALVLLADQPLVESSSVERLVNAFDDKHRVIASHYQGVMGAPALFAHEYFANLLELTGDHGAGAWLRKNPDAVTSVTMNEAAVDIDIPDDIKRIPYD